MPKVSKRKSEDRRAVWRRWGRILVVVAALGGFTGVIWYSYDAGVRKGSRTAVPLLRADHSPIKVAPKDPGGIVAPHKDMMVYDRLDGAVPGGRGPDRLAPDAPAPDKLARDGGALRPPASEAGALSRIRPAAGRAAAPRKPAPPKPPLRSATAAKAPARHNGKAPVQTAQYMGPFRVQLAAYRSPEAAARHWRRLRAKYGKLLGSLNPIIQKADLGAKKGVFYRLQAGPLKSRRAAEALCASLLKRKVSCLVVRL